MNKFSMSNLALVMSYRVSQKEIEKIVDRLGIVPSDNLLFVSSEAVNVASLQVLLKRYTSLADYVLDMNLYVSDAVNRRAQLVCFPQFAGLLPMLIAPQIEQSLHDLRPAADGVPDAGLLHRTLSYYADFAFEAYFHTMAALAARHRIYIMAGSTLSFDGDEPYHRAFLFNQNGELCGCQDKLCLSKAELEMGVEPAGEIRVFESPFGGLAILTGTDADYFETARIAKSLGARILLCPAAFRGEYTPIRSALGLNMRIQETKLYGVQSALCGDTGLGFTLGGGCAVFAPNEMVKQRNGVVLRATDGPEPDVICTALNLDRLEMIQNPYMQDKNRDLMYQYVDKLY